MKADVINSGRIKNVVHEVTRADSSESYHDLEKLNNSILYLEYLTFFVSSLCSITIFFDFSVPCLKRGSIMGTSEVCKKLNKDSGELENVPHHVLSRPKYRRYFQGIDCANGHRQNCRREFYTNQYCEHMIPTLARME